MPQGTKISFVTWPDGKVDGGSLSLFSQRDAIVGFVSGWLPPQWFGTPSLGYVADTLWRGAREKGFRAHTIEIGEGGEPKLVDD